MPYNMSQRSKTLDDEPPKTQRDFDDLANSVKMAILEGIHPKMIEKGSSGSYFARAKKDGKTQVVGSVNSLHRPLSIDVLMRA